MATAVALEGNHDDTGVAHVVWAGLILTIVQSLCVVAVSIINRSLDGSIDRALSAVVVALGAAFTIFYPGLKTRPRTIEGIAGAAGIGLCATFMFILADAFLLQPLGMYTHRWHDVGGGSIWWYIPVWWMVGTYLSWMGGWILANQTNKSGAPSLPAAIVLVGVMTLLCGAVAAMMHFPLAGWNVPTFAVAVMPALALSTAITARGARTA